jgi:peptidoglycan/LPS O-acetylase OafA/YrhL
MAHSDRENNFDLIRLFAALQVAVSHAFAWLRYPLPGWAFALETCFPGVAIFFVISGFLITRSYLRNDGGVLAYLGRRALRIYPALWAQYALVLVLMAATGGFVWHTLATRAFWSWMWRAAFMGSNFWAGALTNYTPFVYTGLYKWYPNDVLWTIPVEIGFYLLVPLFFASWMRRRGLVGIALMAAVAVSMRLAFVAGAMARNFPSYNTTGEMHASPLPYFWLFATGAAAAYYWPHVRRAFDRTVGWWALAYAGGTAVKWWFTGGVDLTYRVPDAYTIPRALILAGLVLSLAHSWPQISRWMRGTDLSYGIYLFHLPLPYALYCAGIGGRASLVALSMAVAFVLAAASWFFIERPALGLKSIVDAKLSSRPSPAGRTHTSGAAATT